MELQGKYNKAFIYTDNADEESIRQIYSMLNNPGFADTRIAVMPDVHVGKGSVVGFTMKFNGYINPGVVGVDIGCGIDAYNIGRGDIDYEAFDLFVRQNIPGGRLVHSKPAEEYFSSSFSMDLLRKVIEKVAPGETGRVLCSIGTLGGGNHFLELDKDPDGGIWLVIHSGSRNFGLKVCRYHQNRAKAYIKDKFKGAGAYHGMEYMPLAEGGEEYLEDMKAAQDYAAENRAVMGRIIIEGFFKNRLSDCRQISSIHNYCDFEDHTIRKGAIAAPKGKPVIIPLNMRDGSIVAKGRGNREWNCSAPHGAGRLFSRSESKELITMAEFEESMKGIYSSSVNKGTVDESPMAYKPSDELISLIQDTVETEFVMKPVYNFKAGNR